MDTLITIIVLSLVGGFLIKKYKPTLWHKLTSRFYK